MPHAGSGPLPPKPDPEPEDEGNGSGGDCFGIFVLSVSMLFLVSYAIVRVAVG